MPGLKVCGFGHSKRRRKARKKVAVVLAIGHTLRAHEALGRPYSLPGFFEVVHSLFEEGVFVGHERSIRTGSILRSPDSFTFSREHADWALRGALMGVAVVAHNTRRYEHPLTSAPHLSWSLRAAATR
jgi:hypothetical protein